MLLAPCSPAVAQDVFTARLDAYRTSPRCVSPAYRGVLDIIGQSWTAYHMTNPATDRGLSVQRGAVVAAQEDALAATAAAKSCRAEATALWRHVARSFDGPAYTVLQHRAVIGLQSLHQGST